LHALFVEDETLLHLSGLPFAREINPVTCQWRPLETDRLVRELRASAERARRSFVTAAHATGVNQTFEVRRGDLGLHVTETCSATDIVVLSSPGRAEAVAAHGVRQLRETARVSAASVLWLPPSAGTRRGPVVAVAADAADSALAVARQIADQTGERLIVAMPDAGAETGLEAAPGQLPVLGDTLPAVVAALGALKERLIVTSRGGPWGEMGAALAASRGVPVLVLE
jgi:hypothetical protein